MIQRFKARLQEHIQEEGKWVQCPTQDCVLVMNSRGNLELEEVTITFPFMEPMDAHYEKGNRLVFNRDGVCISEVASIKAIKAGASSRLPKVINFKNIDPAFPDKYPNKQK